MENVKMRRLIDVDVLEEFIANHTCFIGSDNVLLTPDDDNRLQRVVDRLPIVHEIRAYQAQ